ncbi:hypothetical protein VTI74DRAFT_11310 [Chaetomium olivicolor]
MRRLPRLRASTPAGFLPCSVPSAPLRAPAAAIISSTPSPPRPNTLSDRQTRRCLSTTPLRPSQPTNTQPEGPFPEDDAFWQDLDAAPEPEIQTQLVYPRNISAAPDASSVSDPAYKPAETAEGLAEVGGLADWWEDPSHWGSAAGGARQFVQSVASPFGPTEKVTDPAVLEVLARRAVIESLVVARFAGKEKTKAIDRLFRYAEGGDRLGKLLKADVVAGEKGAVELKEHADYVRTWDLLKSAVTRAKQAAQKNAESAEGEAAAVETTKKPAKLPTPEEAQRFIKSWDKGWKKAGLRNPVVKFFIAKRIQQLTGHRISDGKLVAISTIDALLKQLIEPPKPKKLADLVQSKGVFDGLSNVRVFPRRVTPIDKEQMVGRWKIIVKELEKRELPVTGTGDYGKAVEKRWIEGKA